MRPGDLVQVRKGVQGQGDIGVVICEVESQWNTGFLLQVMFSDGLRDCHTSNLQKPDGRTRRRA